MLGQHPGMYGLPELHLFLADTVGEWWQLANSSSFQMGHGLLRAVAQMVFGGQTEEAVRHAMGWIRRRLHLSTGLLLETLSEVVQPLTIVYPSGSISRRKFLERAHFFFGQAKFVFVSQHPAAYWRVVTAALREAEKYGPVPEWLNRLAFGAGTGDAASGEVLNPQRAWFEISSEALAFLRSLPPAQWLHVRGEDALRSSERELHRVANWLGIKTDGDAIEGMQHPERSPYACFGPRNARYGHNPEFLQAPEISHYVARSEALERPLSWSVHPREFTADVRQMARALGYA